MTYKPSHRKVTVAPVQLDPIPHSTDQILRWDNQGNTGDYDLDYYHVITNGDITDSYNFRYGFNYGYGFWNSSILSNLEPGKKIQLDIIPISHLDPFQDYSNYAYQHESGSRLELTLPQVDLSSCPDFHSYIIYYSDDGSDPTTQLVELVGNNNNVYVTDQLTDGVTYKFRAKLKDNVGNLSDYGDTVTQTINASPNPVTGASIAYTQAARTAQITATKPSPQDSDVTGYRIKSSYLDGFGPLRSIVDGVDLAFVEAADDIDYTTFELSPGRWLFSIVAVDKSGLESQPVELELNLAMSGSDLVEIATEPKKPIYIDAYPLASGVVEVKVTLEETDNTTAIKIFRDDVLDGSVTVDTDLTYTYQTGALTDGQEYSFYAKSANGSVYSDQTDTVTTIADANAPDCDRTITIQIRE